MQKNMMIIGATSSIAQAVAKLYVEKGDQLYLVGRNAQFLANIADDLHVRSGKQVNYDACDLAEWQNHPRIIEAAIKTLGHIDLILIAHGSLADQKACEKNIQQTFTEINTNLLSYISLLTLFADYFEQRQHGCIAVITSVAGDRGRQSNYIYGTAKGGLTIFLQGLRNRLYHAGVNVLTIKPGFIDTPMTKHIKKGLLWATPDQIAKQIQQAIDKGKQQIYVPGFWRYIMLIIKLLPERIFCRLKL